MARFLVTYHGGEGPPDAELRDAVRSWLAQAGTAVVDPGTALRVVTQLSAAEPEQVCEIGGYSLIEAASIEAASGLLRSHPFLERGGTLQINELMQFS